MTYMFEVGCTYTTQAGDSVQVIGRSSPTESCSEAVECSDGLYRYDRANNHVDAGRVTGTAHDYSYEHNFCRKQAGTTTPIVEECPAEDKWNCKYCDLIRTCTLHSEAKTSPAVNKKSGRTYTKIATVLNSTNNVAGQVMVAYIDGRKLTPEQKSFLDSLTIFVRERQEFKEKFEEI